MTKKICSLTGGIRRHFKCASVVVTGLGGTVSSAVLGIAGLAMILLSPICYMFKAPLISVALAIAGWGLLIGLAWIVEGN